MLSFYVVEPLTETNEFKWDVQLKMSYFSEILVSVGIPASTYSSKS